MELSHRHQTEEIAPVRILVISAAGLEVDGWYSSPQVFCTVEVQGRPDTKYETPLVDSRLELVWNYDIEMLPCTSTESIVFALWGKYWGSSREALLGRVTLQSSQFRPAGFDNELPLFECKQAIAPRLRIKVDLLKERVTDARTSLSGLHVRDRLLGPAGGFTRRDSIRIWEAPSGSEKRHILSDERNLGVTIYSASGLPKADFMGWPDPYCICEVPGKSNSGFQTAVVRNTLDPVWNCVGEVANYAPGDQLQFSVWDCGKSPSFLGRVSVPVSTFWGGFDGELSLERTGRDAPAKIRVKIDPAAPQAPDPPPSITGLHIRERLFGSRPMSPSPEELAGPKAIEQLEVAIIGAIGLRKADFLGKSDPYCICELPGKERSRRRTRTIDNTLDPVWNDTFQIEDYVPGEVLSFTVMDEDWSKKDDLLGRAFLASSQFYPNGYCGELDLQDAGGKGIAARLRIEVRIMQPDTRTGLHIRKRAKAPFERISEAKARWKRQAVVALIEMADTYRQQVLSATRDVVIESLVADPDMWRCATRAITRCVEVLWHDVIMEMEAMVRDARVLATSDAPVKTAQSLGMIGERPHPCSYQGARAFLLYHFLPYDKSMFGCLADPLYICFFCLSLIPDVRVVFYFILLLLFLCPGPPDEFQLVQYIMMFKGTQFISSGLAMMAWGGFQYYLCVQEFDHTCHQMGPGASQNTLVGLLDICGSCMLVWSAFRLLDISEKTSGDREHDRLEASGTGHDAGEDAEEDDDEDGILIWRCCCRGRHREGRGGRLRGFLTYDLLCFCASCGLLVFLELMHWHRSYEEYPNGFEQWFDRASKHMQSWKFKATLYWARVFYSLLALPFMLFNIPVLQSVLTHTVPTGFNPRGRVVTYMLRPMPRKHKEDDPEKERGPPDGVRLSVVEEESLLQGMVDVEHNREAVLMARIATVAVDTS